MFIKIKLHLICSVLLVAIGTSCATYYQKSIDTEKALIAHDYDKATNNIEKSKFLTKKRNHLLYYLELGKAQHLAGKFEESNISLNRADLMMENYRSVFDMALGVTVNEAIQPYASEAHEKILVHYYKALNYMQLGNVEEAIVEARRINLSSLQNEEDANGKDRKYGNDPFGLILMGMLYEADRDYNNAFIAYRNAKKIYDTDETGLFRGKEPYTLKQDLARTGAFAGMNYESTEVINDMPYGEAIIFWENGLAPIKEEKNMFFSLTKTNGAYYYISGDLVIPIDYDFEKNDSTFKASDIGLIRMASAFYRARPARTNSASLSHNKKTAKTFQLIEDVTGIAFQIERDNYLKELGKNLLRLTLKKISEMAVAEKNEYAGLALGIANVATEKADTRNWQSLPSQISYLRIPLEKGTNTIDITTNTGEKFSFVIEGRGGTVFRNVVTY